MFRTTALGLSTTPIAVISSNTTWADTKGGHHQDPVPFSMHNPSTAQSIRWGGATVSTDGTGFPLSPGQTLSFGLLKSDPIFAMTTAGELTLNVVAGRQIGGSLASDG